MDFLVKLPKRIRSGIAIFGKHTINIFLYKWLKYYIDGVLVNKAKPPKIDQQYNFQKSEDTYDVWNPELKKTSQYHTTLFIL